MKVLVWGDGKFSCVGDKQYLYIQMKMNQVMEEKREGSDSKVDEQL